MSRRPKRVNVTNRRISRRPIETLFQLYGSPVALLRAVRKATSILREEGTRGFVRAVRAKLNYPNLPVHILQRDSKNQLMFEERWVLRGAGLTRVHSTSIIVLTGGNQRLLDTCLLSLSRSIFHDALVNVLVVNNGGLISLPPRYPFPVSVLREERKFNWSAYNNHAARTARGQFLLLLNDDVEALHGGWLDSMLAEATQPEVGAVGAKLLYPVGLVQHYGIAVDRHGDVFPVHRFRPRDFDKANGELAKPHEVMAVTGACLLTATATWRTCPFDEVFALSYNDVDYCLRLRAAGKRIVVTPYAELVHSETTTRPLAVSLREKWLFTKKWAGIATGGPDPSAETGEPLIPGP